MAQQYSSSAVQKLPSACTEDLIAPTFSGISLVTPNSDGSFTVNGPTPTGGTQPYTFEIHIVPGTSSAGVLFAQTPADISRALPRRVYLDSNGDPILKDQLYTLGIRVRSASNNLNTNTTVLTSTAIGSVNLAQVYQDLVAELQQQIDRIVSNVRPDLTGVIPKDVPPVLTGTVDSTGELKGTVKG